MLYEILTQLKLLYFSLSMYSLVMTQGLAHRIFHYGYTCTLVIKWRYPMTGCSRGNVYRALSNFSPRGWNVLNEIRFIYYIVSVQYH